MLFRSRVAEAVAVDFTGVQRSVGVRVDLHPSPPALSSAGPLETVLRHLVENAVRHAPGAPLTVTARERMDSVEVSVADRGPGLKDEDRERVFEKFYRAGDAPGGAGLGLAICRAVVEAHGGRIVAENRPGGGAVFRMDLPRGTG